MKKKGLSFLLIYLTFFLVSAFTEMPAHDLQKLCKASTQNISLDPSTDSPKSYIIRGHAKQCLTMRGEDISPMPRLNSKRAAPIADEFSASPSSYSTIDKAKLTINTASPLPQSISTNSKELEDLAIIDQLREENLRKIIYENQNSKPHEH